MRRVGRRRAARAFAGLAAGGVGLLAGGCARVPAGPPGPLPYEAEIRRTAYGIPHVKAADYGSLGFGAGYASAEDNLCLMADLFLTAGAERSRFLGPGEGNLESDFFYQRLIDLREAEEPGLRAETVDFLRGAAAGYNGYLRETGVDRLPDPTCRGAAWVREIGELDLRRLQRTNQFTVAMLPLLVAAVPPGGDGARRRPSVPELLASLDSGGRGSNAIALGSEATAGGRGMFLGNPHQPWHGSFRFYEKHLTIPGELDVIGASPVGLPAAGVGHTRWVAWNGTVSTARRFSFYRLALVPGDPTRYLFDGEARDMAVQEVAVTVRMPDGSLERRRHAFYATHFGPLVAGRAPFAWNADTAWVLRNVDPGWRTSNESFEIQRARSVREVKAILERFQGWPVNLIAADSSGEVLYADPGSIGHVTDEQQAACAVPGGLDGTRSECQWGSDPDAAIPGIFGPARLPHLFRRDWVANANSSYWLTNPAVPLEGFPRALGDERTARSLRTRLMIHMIQERLAGGGRFTLDQLRSLMFNNRHYAGELLRDDLVALCRARPRVELADGARVELGEACRVLAGWDLRVDLASRGAHLFRQFMSAGGGRFRVPFDPDDPVGTPRGLDREDPEVLRALGLAVRELREAGLALDAPLGQVQHVTRAGEVIPIHGGPGRQGVFNAIRAPFRSARGYPEVEAGSSFIMAVEFRADGPVSHALVTYSQSADPTSPHFADQTRLYSRKEWVPLRFREADVLADPALRAYAVRGPR